MKMMSVVNNEFYNFFNHGQVDNTLNANCKTECIGINKSIKY